MDDVESIRARHKNARPNPIVNPAWANAERDIGALLDAYDKLLGEWYSMSQDDGKVERALERAQAETLEAYQTGFQEGVAQGRRIAECILDDLKRKLVPSDADGPAPPL